MLKFINSPKLNYSVKFEVFWTPNKFLFDDGCFPFSFNYFWASLALFSMLVFQKYMFFLNCKMKIQFLLKLLFILGHQLVGRGYVDLLQQLLRLLDNDSLEIDFFWLYSAFSLSSNGIRSVAINYVFCTNRVQDSKCLWDFLDAFLGRYNSLKMPKINFWLTYSHLIRW